MRYLFLITVGLFFSSGISALEYEKNFENDHVCISRVKIMPQEEVGEHYDRYSQLVIALQGGIITRLEADGSSTDVEFPTGQFVLREAETPDMIHKSVNKQSEPIELIIVQLKSTAPCFLAS